MRHDHGAEGRREVRRHGMHGHVCQTPGCGVAWYHDGDTTATLDEEAYTAAHTCGKCGKTEYWHIGVPEHVRKVGDALHKLDAVIAKLAEVA